MKYGICHLSIVPLRAEAGDPTEMVTQVLYGDTLVILEEQKNWSFVKLHFDGYEGWIDNKQFTFISEEKFNILSTKDSILSSDFVDFVTTKEGQLLTIPLGCSLNGLAILEHKFEGNSVSGTQQKQQLIDSAMLYLNAPYLWGGKTPFGIDCSGFTQIVYRLNGYALLRDASQQATQGDALSFIEESEAGDLAFFDNEEGTIVHVGIILEDHKIIHAHGKVRIDQLDQSGIFNGELGKHTHKLRVIKRIISQ